MGNAPDPLFLCKKGGEDRQLLLEQALGPAADRADRPAESGADPEGQPLEGVR